MELAIKTVPGPGAESVWEPLRARELEKINLLVDCATDTVGLLPVRVIVPPERENVALEEARLITLAQTPELVTETLPDAFVKSAELVSPLLESHGVPEDPVQPIDPVPHAIKLLVLVLMAAGTQLTQLKNNTPDSDKALTIFGIWQTMEVKLFVESYPWPYKKKI